MIKEIDTDKLKAFIVSYDIPLSQHFWLFHVCTLFFNKIVYWVIMLPCQCVGVLEIYLQDQRNFLSICHIERKLCVSQSLVHKKHLYQINISLPDSSPSSKKNMDALICGSLFYLHKKGAKENDVIDFKFNCFIRGLLVYGNVLKPSNRNCMESSFSLIPAWMVGFQLFSLLL